MTRQPGLTIYKHDKAYQGYTIFAPQTGTDVYLVDMRGNVVHRWQMPYRPANYGYILGQWQPALCRAHRQRPRELRGHRRHSDGSRLGRERPVGI